MSFMTNFEFWKLDKFFDEDTRAELSALDPEADKKDIEDRFYCDLEFGTGGLRSLMGAGTNRMNKYTVGKATTGLGKYLLDRYGAAQCLSHGVAIAYDTRNNSEVFASVAADILTGMCIRVLLFDKPVPTPELSFTVKHLNCIAGIVLTASHNPKEYNGYKVYDESGCQLVPRQAEKVTRCINAVNDYTGISFTGNDALKTMIDVTDDFVAAVLKQSLLTDLALKQELKVVYTPLHGSGNIPVRRALALDGFTDITVVPEQELPDGNFSTVKSPNPEDRNALNLGFALSESLGADIVLGTDPDGDRVGVGIRTADGENRLLTGNQIGVLLLDYVLSHKDLSTVRKPAVVRTVVTSELGAEIAKKRGLTVFSTLTGFKYIGEKITQFEAAKAEGRESGDYTFILGYEESYGYLVGTHAGDKDAVVSSLLICEMAAEYKGRGITLLDRMNEIYAEFGYYRDAQDCFTLRGKDGLEEISAIMEGLRSGISLFDDTVRMIDYSVPVAAEPGFGMLPASNVLNYVLADGAWVAVRPSGTEGMIKVYYSVRGGSEVEVKRRLKWIRGRVLKELGCGF